MSDRVGTHTSSGLRGLYQDVQIAPDDRWGPLWLVAREFDPLATTGLRLESPPALEVTVHGGDWDNRTYRVVRLMTLDEAHALPSTLSRMLSFTPTGAVLKGEPFTLPAHLARGA